MKYSFYMRKFEYVSETNCFINNEEFRFHYLLSKAMGKMSILTRKLSSTILYDNTHLGYLGETLSVAVREGSHMTWL